MCGYSAGCLSNTRQSGEEGGQGYLWVSVSPRKLCKMGTTQFACAEPSARDRLSSPKCPWEVSTIFSELGIQ